METSNAEITTAVEPAATDVKAEETAGGESAPPVKVADTSEDTSSWTEKAQKRYDELTRKAYEAQGERDRERYQREALEAQLAELKKAKTEPVAPETFPTLEQFGYDEGKYQSAIAAHFAKLASEQGTAAAQKALKEERARAAEEQALKGWASREAELIKSKPDYVDKVKNAATLPISQEMQKVLMEHELGPQIALYMVENAEASRAIARLPMNLQLMEVGRIAGKVEAAKALPKPPVSQAPPPVGKVENDEAVVSVKVDSADSDTLSDREWTRRRNAQEQARIRKSRGG